MEKGDADWERAHLIRWVWCEGGRHRLGERALESEREWMKEEDTDWERAHLRVERNRGEKFRLGESALDRMGMVWRWKTPTGRERT